MHAFRRVESAYSTLDKILTLEQRLGFQDLAVMGGLEPYLGRWANNAREESGPDHFARIDELTAAFRGYGQLDAAGRQDAVATGRALLAKLNAEGLWTGRFIPRGRDAGDGSPDEQSVPTPAPSDHPAVSVQAAPPQAAAPPAGPVPGTDHPEPTEPVSAGETEQSGVSETAPAGREPAPRLRQAVITLDSPVSRMTGIGDGYAARLSKLKVETIRDLLYLFPRRYNDFADMRRIASLRPGEVVTIAGTINDISNVTTKRGLVRTTAVVADETGSIHAVWFNQIRLIQTLSKGRQVVLSGKVDLYLGKSVMQTPEWELLESEDLIHTARLVPVYPLTHDIHARWLRRQQFKTVERWAPEVADHLPLSVRQSTGLPDLTTALGQIHFPDTPESLEKARRRLAFDEFMQIQIGLLLRRRDWREAQTGTPLRVDPNSVAAFQATLPFTFTGGQQHALDDILADLARQTPMARLLQGDVGSGKTVVAAAAVRVALDNGLQAAVMAPTEILAEQHYKTFCRLLGAAPDEALEGAAPPAGPVVRLLSGSMRDADKARTRQEIASGKADVVIGTQAIIQESVEFGRLGLVVIDEQHRFGVMQRAALRQKGFSPHVLVMTATPIPRTLALTIYGDLDLSVISEMPPGRQPIKTHWLGPRERERAYTLIRKEAAQGRQTFVVCPLVEESEVLEVKAATEEFERLRASIFADLRLGLLHGRMKPAEKEQVMRSFRDRELDVLVSTPVVEVGIDIPNATVMLIEGADRFGLSQMHQFRGRVGRGGDQSYCLLLSEKPSDEARARLGAIENSQDGFVLAEEDLKLRGPGEFFGVRQSGLPDLKVAKLGDVAILEQARAEALKVFAADPRLDLPEHQLLKQQVARFWESRGEAS